MQDPRAEFERQRPRLFGLAYRLLGSDQEAEDVVQDAYLRWSGGVRYCQARPSNILNTCASEKNNHSTAQYCIGMEKKLCWLW